MHHAEDGQEPDCEECGKVIFSKDHAVIISDANGLPDFYHTACFFGVIGKMAKKYARPKVNKEQLRLPFISRYHLCEKCFRMMDSQKDDVYMHSENGDTYYRHHVCPPLKEKWIPQVTPKNRRT